MRSGSETEWTWRLEWGEAAPGLWVGSCPMRPGDMHTIVADTGASALLSVQHDDCLAYWDIDWQEMQASARGLQITLERVPIRDFDIDDMRRQLPDSVARLAALQRDGHRTYVYCTAGLGRSPLVVLGYLTLVENRSPDDAIAAIHSARPGAVPAWEALQDAVADLTERYREAIERRAYALYEQRIHQDAAADWYGARREVIRAALRGEPLP